MSADALARARTARRVPLLHLGLFLATAATTIFAGGVRWALEHPAAGPGWAGWLGAAPADVALAGLPFAAALLGILLAHEMGHYLSARAHGVDATLPYFIPVPFGVGTFGAVIRLRSALPSRRATLDVGLAGPVAGLLVALPLLAVGLAHAQPHVVQPVPPSPPSGLLPLALHLLRGGGGLEHAGDQFGHSLLSWAVERAVVGRLPPGLDLPWNPVAFAARIGLFVTTLNLLPLGQLDGGHATYALLGRERARRLSRAVSWALLGAGLFLCWTWLAWWAITRFAVKLDHPPALDEAPLDPARRAAAWLGLALFVITWVPIPVS